jgi:hypothetical protein
MFGCHAFSCRWAAAAALILCVVPGCYRHQPIAIAPGAVRENVRVRFAMPRDIVVHRTRGGVFDTLGFRQVIGLEGRLGAVAADTVVLDRVDQVIMSDGEWNVSGATATSTRFGPDIGTVISTPRHDMTRTIIVIVATVGVLYALLASSPSTFGSGWGSF